LIKRGLIDSNVFLQAVDFVQQLLLLKKQQFYLEVFWENVDALDGDEIVTRLTKLE